MTTTDKKTEEQMPNCSPWTPPLSPAAWKDLHIAGNKVRQFVEKARSSTDLLELEKMHEKTVKIDRGFSEKYPESEGNETAFRTFVQRGTFEIIRLGHVLIKSKCNEQNISIAEWEKLDDDAAGLGLRILESKSLEEMKANLSLAGEFLGILKQKNPELYDICGRYYLRGFEFDARRRKSELIEDDRAKS